MVEAGRGLIGVGGYRGYSDINGVGAMFECMACSETKEVRPVLVAYGYASVTLVLERVRVKTHCLSHETSYVHNFQKSKLRKKKFFRSLGPKYGNYFRPPQFFQKYGNVSVTGKANAYRIQIRVRNLKTISPNGIDFS